MHQTLTKSHEDATLAWLQVAIEYAYSHGQHTALAYLEAVVEDVLFEEEITARISSVLG